MSDLERSGELNRILGAFLEAEEAGVGIDAEELIRRHPHLADDLRRFFAGRDRVERIAAPLRTEDRRTTPTPPPGGGAGTLPDVSRDVQASAPAPRKEGPPVRVPGYDVECELGRGGMGVVYRARHRKLNRTVALKMMIAGAHADEGDRDRFYAEATAIARLNHPNIVQIHEVGEHGGVPYLALEFCEGGSLGDKLDGTPLPPKEAAQLVATLAGAVLAAHERQIVHRDLKPANVLLTAAATLKVTDFGLAKDMGADGKTASGAVVGTPSYMAPEQAAAERGKVGPASDVYALGAILYECLTGRPPFKGPTQLDTLLQVMHDEPVPPRHLQPGLPRDLETVCLKCLQKEPAKRYPSAAELAEDLGRFCRSEPVRARPVGALDRGWRWCRRNPAVAALLGSLLLVLTLGAAVSTLFGLYANAKAGEANEKAEDAEREALRADEKAEDAKREAGAARAAERLARQREYGANMLLTQTAWEQHQVDRFLQLLQGQMPREGEEDRRGFEWHYWRTQFQCGHVTLKGHTDRVLAVAFSPDGKRLASGSRDHTVRVWYAQTGQTALTLTGHRSEVLSVAFSPDGKRLASAADHTVRVWDAQTGQEQLTLSEPRDVKSVAFSPDGRCLAGGSCDFFNPEKGEVKVWDAQTGQKVLTLQGHTREVSSVAFSPDGKRLASASGDQTVKVWDAQTGQELLTLKGHGIGVTSVAFSLAGQRLASASSDGTVKVWDASWREADDER
jgi:tRNA A-37 threonylcarbamoyl transferase component Bud32